MGTSIDDSYKAIHEGDHPHACGDKCRSVLLSLMIRGSSPRVWGQVLRLTFATNYLGIIPTRVGTSKLPVEKLIEKMDHPHACGDKLKCLVINTAI